MHHNKAKRARQGHTFIDSVYTAKEGELLPLNLDVEREDGEAPIQKFASRPPLFFSSIYDPRANMGSSAPKKSEGLASVGDDVEVCMIIDMYLFCSVCAFV